MPALNFSEQFADRVESGTKQQTIRRKRKHPIKYGDTLYLYTGMRTKDCRKLGEGECHVTRSIRIKGGRVWLDGLRLSDREAFLLADADGFDGLDAFFAWFESHYGPDFEGVLICW